jgi:hypothetical protein
MCALALTPLRSRLQNCQIDRNCVSDLTILKSAEPSNNDFPMRDDAIAELFRAHSAMVSTCLKQEPANRLPSPVQIRRSTWLTAA